MLHSVINRISRLFAWWIGDIRGRKSLIGKAASLVIGIFVPRQKHKPLATDVQNDDTLAPPPYHRGYL